MLHGEDRQLQPHQASHFTRPQAARVHHVLRVHLAALGNHIPGAVAARLQVQYARVPYDLRAADLRGLRIGVRHAVGIHVPLDGIQQRAHEMPFVDDREYPCRLVGRDELELHAQIAAARLGHLQPVEALARAGEHDAAGHVQAA